MRRNKFILQSDAIDIEDHETIAYSLAGKIHNKKKKKYHEPVNNVWESKKICLRLK